VRRLASKEKEIAMKTARLCLLLALAPLAAGAQTIVGWNNLGMHCMDADYSVFSILPPYNTIHAQVMDASGLLLTNCTVTYQAIADPTGSINTTSAGKTEFWQYCQALFGVSLPVNVGLPVPGPNSFSMPLKGTQPMELESSMNWFAAYGIPLTPYDDALQKNPYPMMRLVAKSGNNVIAQTDIVLPVSDEMDCSACHASGSGDAAKPSAGWVNDPNPQRDYRLNILRLHDEKNNTGLFTNTPVLCASCHLSEALPGTGKPGIPALTASMHGFHAHVVDPTNGLTLDASDNRSACYRCHPGSTTRCLRGAMGSAVAPDGTMAMQCQSCHGSMSMVGATTRTGWLDEPNCQACHNGGNRYTSVFDSPGHMRVPADMTFATTPNVPATGFSLYRFSTGHGGLYCEACHGSTHAEFPSLHDNDNVTSIQHQGHVGVLVECNICHGTQPSTVNGGPHGMHPVGQTWVNHHGDVGEGGGGTGQCQGCHGADYRGTFLSRSQADRSISAFGTKTFWRGFQIGCYTCHNGPGSDNANNNHPAVASNASVSTARNTPVAIALHATDPDGNALTYRLVSQGKHGSVGLAGSAATYYPETGYVGTDTFTFSAWDGQTDSNLGKVSIGVGEAAPQSDFAGHWIDMGQTCKSKCTLKGHFAVVNAGTAKLPASALAVYLSNNPVLDSADTFLKQYKVKAIAAGRSVKRNIKITLPAGSSASGKYVIALVDADDAVADPDDTDNFAVYGPMP
jgi:hypothetical protein